MRFEDQLSVSLAYLLNVTIRYSILSILTDPMHEKQFIPDDMKKRNEGRSNDE